MDIIEASSDADFSSDHWLRWAGCGAMAISACALSFLLQYQHLVHFSKPRYQTHIVRILLMVPVYALSAFFTYHFVQWEYYFEFVRSCFEAFVIYEFFVLLLCYLGDSEIEQRRVLASKKRERHLFPFCCYTFDPSMRFFLMDIKLSVLQYAVIRPLTVILAIILQAHDALQPGSMDPRYGNFWIVLLNFVSVSIAMYALVLFFAVIHRDIAEYRPITKLLAVKAIVFMTWWQSLAIGALALFGLLPTSADWTPQTVATRLQAMLVCLEVLVISVWHMNDHCFGVGDFKVALPATTLASPTCSSFANTTGSHRLRHNQQQPCYTISNPLESLKQTFDPRETLHDILAGTRHVFRKIVLFMRRQHEPVMLDDVDFSVMVDLEERQGTNNPNLGEFMTLAGNPVH